MVCNSLSHNLLISYILKYEWWYFHFTDKEIGSGGEVTRSYMDSKDFKCEKLLHKPQVLLLAAY